MNDQKRPEYVTCVRHTHADKKHTAWCGRSLGPAFAFVDIDHAAYNALAHGRLLTCPECRAAILSALGGQP